MGFGLLLGFTLASLCSAVCHWESPDGTYFDLSPLTLKNGDYTGSNNDHAYTMNVCGTSHAGGACTSEHATICQWSKGDPKQFVANLGSMNKSPAPVFALIDATDPKKGLSMTFMNGDQCGTNKAKAIVYFPCASQTSTQFTVTEGGCIYNLMLPALEGCPTDKPAPEKASGLSGGWIFIIIVACCVPTYLAMGILYNTKRRGTSGVESIPNIEFWRALPGLCKDGCLYSWRSTQALIAKLQGPSKTHEQI